MRIRLKEERLVDLLKRRGISQNHWARQLGLSRGHLSELVNGRRPYPHPETRRKLLDGLGVSFEELFEVERPEPTPERSATPGMTPGMTPAPIPTDPGRRAPILESVLADGRYAVRRLFATPSFTIVALLTLALGIGAGSAIFTIVDAVLLRPLPFPTADRIMRVWETSGDWQRNAVSPANFLDWRDQNESFERLAAYASQNVSMTGAGEAIRLAGYRVSGDFFDILGVGARFGRSLSPADDRPGIDRAVMSHAAFERLLGGDPRRLESPVVIDGRPVTIVGVMPPTFHFPDTGTDLWIPLSLSDAERQTRGFRTLRVIGQLRAGVARTEAHAEMKTIASRLEAEYPRENENVSANVVALGVDLVRPVRSTLLIVVGAIACVMLIVCVNVANLMLTRAINGADEIAVRRALGANRTRIVRQVLTESVVLALAGGLLGLMVARGTTRFLLTLIPDHVPMAAEVSLDTRALLFTIGISTLTALLFGAVPAHEITRRGPVSALRGAGRSIGNRSHHRMRAALVAAEVAMAVVLLIGSGLLIRSFAVVLDQDHGIDLEPTLVAELSLPPVAADGGPQRFAYFERVLEQATAIAGVEQVAWATRAPMLLVGGALIYTPEGQATSTRDAVTRVVSADYFGVLGVELRGRPFTARDRSGTEPVVVVSEAFARRVWPGEEAIGKRLRIGDTSSGRPLRTVVGVAADVHQWGPEQEARETMYLPFRQASPSGFFAPRDLLVRATGDPAGVIGTLRGVLTEIDPDVPITSLRSMDDVLADTVAPRRFTMKLFAAFGGVALVLAALGIYGVVDASVSQRRREIGIRMALGARVASICVWALRFGALPVALGVVLGLATATVATRLLSGLLYGVGALDLATFVAIPAALLAVGCVAALLPARRAGRIEPIAVLRDD